MNINITIPQSSFDQQETVFIPVYLDTQNDAVNAIEGAITFPANLLEVQEVQDGNSRINFWVHSPTVKNGAIVFSGITPGGFSGHKELLFTMKVRTASSTGTGELVTRINAFLNDGLGTQMLVRDIRVPFSITSQTSDADTSQYHDIDPPETFRPIIGRDNQVFDGQYFLVFSTQDKGVGIDHYQVREGIFAKYHTTTSPMIVTDQKLHTNIFVKAIDRAGNERVEKVSGIISPITYVILIFIVILITSSIVGSIYKKTWRKFIR